jgi:hypothetical protein
VDTQGALQLAKLWSEISREALDPALPNQSSWAAGHGRLHANIQLDRYIRIRLSQGSTRFAGADCIWKCRTPLKCKGILMAWYTIQLWTSDRGSRHGLNDQTAPCYIYLLEDTTDHSLRSTGLSHCFNASSIQLASPQITDQLEDWWLTSRAHFGKTPSSFVAEPMERGIQITITESLRLESKTS